MNTQHTTSPRLFFTVIAIFLIAGTSLSQIAVDLKDTTTQADYIIITPGAYVSAAQQLGTFRSAHSSLSVKLVIVDSIYHQFTTSAADSSIREFIRFTLDHWKKPRPKYFLLAGNVNVIPSHKEEGLQLPPDIFEDSIMVDQWFVKNTVPQIEYRASIGRFPAWNLSQLQTMVNKTISYQTALSASWMNRAIIVADSTKEETFTFEFAVKDAAFIMYPLWSDTVIAHLRPSSPNYLNKETFRNQWNNGAGVILYAGMSNEQQLSRTRYFSTDDIPFLTNIDKLPISLFIAGGLHFEKQDSAELVVDLLKSPLGGSVATIGPSGITYISIAAGYINSFLFSLTKDTSAVLGDAMLIGMNMDTSPFAARMMTLLGDPALSVRKAITLSVDGKPTVPGEFSLKQNFPNPFNPSTMIQFTLPSEQYVSMKVYNMLGQEVAALINEVRSQGTHTISFNAVHLSAGMYVYRIQAGNYSAAKKMMLVK